MQDVPSDHHIPNVYDELDDPSEPVRVLDECTDPAVIVRELFLALLQSAIQLHDVRVL